MRDYAQIAPTFWTRGSGRALRDDPLARLCALYLMTSPSSNMIGLYYLPLSTLAHELGCPLEGASKALRRLEQEGVALFDSDADLVWLPNMASWQLGERLSPKDKRHKWVVKEYEQFGNHSFVRRFYERYGEAFSLPKPKGLGSPSEAPSMPLRSKEKEKEKEQEKDPPLTPQGADEGDGNREWGVEPEPECESAVLQVRRESGSVQAYQAAYERGIAAGRGGAPYAMPDGERGALHQAMQTHARDEAGKALRGSELLAWIEHYAAEMVRWIARRPPEKRKFWPNPGPKAFLRFLNETAEAPEPNPRSGPAPPRNRPENASLTPGRPMPRPAGEGANKSNLGALFAKVGNGGVT